MTIAVLIPGALTTFQDLGRAGFGSAGVPPSGAFDVFALRAANLLVGNAEGAPALEITMSGPTLRFETDAVVALAGSRFATTLDGELAPRGRTIRVRAGQTLAVGWTQEGARSYLAIAGLISEERALRSASRHVAAELGPPPLESGDVLVTTARDEVAMRSMRPLREYEAEAVVRATRGAQWEAFASHSRTSFFSDLFRVTMDSNRTGIRLEGPAIDHAGPGEIDPEGTTPGAVQVPPNGRAIILGPDGPATGGYPKLAAVIAADLCVLAHAKPGDTVRFREVSVEEARAAWDERERALHDAID